MKYPLPLRLIHWLMALLIIGMLSLGFYMANLPQDAPGKYDWYPTHKSLGFIVGTLLVIRLMIRIQFKTELPEPSPYLQDWEKRLSHLVHGLLYLAMFSMVYSGYMMNATFEYASGLDVFGWFTIPDIVEKSAEKNALYRNLHGFSAFAFVGLLVLHLAGVIKHRFVDGKEASVLKRMV